MRSLYIYSYFNKIRNKLIRMYNLIKCKDNNDVVTVTSGKVKICYAYFMLHMLLRVSCVLR